MNTTEHAAQIRAQLKHKGWTSRQISVRADYFSMGSSIDVHIKDAAVPLQAVKDIAEKAERIDRCQITGEILNGGNRYVSVGYTCEALTIIGRRYADAVQRAVHQREASGNNSLIPVDGTPYTIGKTDTGSISLWSDYHLMDGYDVDAVARHIGVLMNI